MVEGTIRKSHILDKSLVSASSEFQSTEKGLHVTAEGVKKYFQDNKVLNKFHCALILVIDQEIGHAPSADTVKYDLYGVETRKKPEQVIDALTRNLQSAMDFWKIYKSCRYVFAQFRQNIPEKGKKPEEQQLITQFNDRYDSLLKTVDNIETTIATLKAYIRSEPKLANEQSNLLKLVS